MNTAHGARSVIIELTPRRVVVKRPGHLPVARLCHWFSQSAGNTCHVQAQVTCVCDVTCESTKCSDGDGSYRQAYNKQLRDLCRNLRVVKRADADESTINVNRTATAAQQQLEDERTPVALITLMPVVHVGITLKSLMSITLRLKLLLVSDIICCKAVNGLRFLQWEQVRILYSYLSSCIIDVVG